MSNGLAGAHDASKSNGSTGVSNNDGESAAVKAARDWFTDEPKTEKPITPAQATKSASSGGARSEEVSEKPQYRQVLLDNVTLACLGCKNGCSGFGNEVRVAWQDVQEPVFEEDGTTPKTKQDGTPITEPVKRLIAYGCCPSKNHVSQPFQTWPEFADPKRLPCQQLQTGEKFVTILLSGEPSGKPKDFGRSTTKVI